MLCYPGSSVFPRALLGPFQSCSWIFTVPGGFLAGEWLNAKAEDAEQEFPAVAGGQGRHKANGILPLDSFPTASPELFFPSCCWEGEPPAAATAMLQNRDTSFVPPRSGRCRYQETRRGGSDRDVPLPTLRLPTASASAPFCPHRGGNVPRKTFLGLRCSFPELGLCWPGGNFGFPAPAAARAEPGPCSPRAHGCSLREARQGPLCG